MNSSFILALSLCLASSVVCQSLNDTTSINPPECGKIVSDIYPKTKRFLSSKFLKNQNNVGWLVFVSGPEGKTCGNLINSQWVLTNAKNIE
jgi:hypothetical protein